MSIVRPEVPGVASAAADAFARSRILALRATRAEAAWSARLSVVRCSDINTACGTAQDATWWDLRKDEHLHHDHGISLDVALALLAAQTREAVVGVWARHGRPEPAQSDIEWLVALGHAAALTGGAPPPLLVITRWGWRLLPQGTSRAWQRLRHRARPHDHVCTGSLVCMCAS